MTLFSLTFLIFSSDIKASNKQDIAQCVSDGLQNENMESWSKREIRELCTCFVDNDSESLSSEALGEKCVDLVFNKDKKNNYDNNDYGNFDPIQISIKGRKKVVGDTNECTIFYNDNGMDFNRAMNICSCYYNPAISSKFSSNFSMVSRYCQSNNPPAKFTQQPNQIDRNYQRRIQRDVQNRPSFEDKFRNRLEDRIIDRHFKRMDDIFDNEWQPDMYD